MSAQNTTTIVTMTYISLNKLFYNISNKKIIDDISIKANGDLKEDEILTIVSEKILEQTPKCECTKDPIQGVHAIGRVCDNCGVQVKDPTILEFKPILWFKKIPGTKGFLSPNFMLTARNDLGKKMDVLRWVCDPTYPATKKDKYWLARLGKQPDGRGGFRDGDIPGFERSYDWLIDNLKLFLTFLLEKSPLKSPKKQQLLNLIKIVDIYGMDTLVSDYVPIINKRLLIKENTTMGKFANIPALAGTIGSARGYINALRKYNVGKLSKENASSVMADFTVTSANVGEIMYKDFLGGKPGLVRKHISGTRTPYTARAVITSIIGPHDYNEIHLPWSLSVALFRPMILNLLMKRKRMTKRKAERLVDFSVMNITPELRWCFDTLLAEAKEGIWLTIERNPSLPVGSIQACTCTKIKDDISDLSISMGMLMTTPQNADFDGDEETVVLQLDKTMIKLIKRLDLSASVPSQTEPFTVSGALKIPDPATTIISNYLSKKPKNDTINNVGKLDIKVGT